MYVYVYDEKVGHKNESLIDDHAIGEKVRWESDNEADAKFGKVFGRHQYNQ